MVLFFWTGNEANSKSGIELECSFLILPEIVFSSRSNRLEVKQVRGVSTEKDKLCSLMYMSHVLVPRPEINILQGA